MHYAFYNEILCDYKSAEWFILFTGSFKTFESVTLISTRLLNLSSSICTAKAAKKASSTCCKFIIEAAVISVKKNVDIKQNQKLLNVHQRKLRIMWVPSHTDIKGNYDVDKAVTEAYTATIFLKLKQFEHKIEGCMKLESIYPPQPTN